VKKKESQDIHQIYKFEEEKGSQRPKNEDFEKKKLPQVFIQSTSVPNST